LVGDYFVVNSLVRGEDQVLNGRVDWVLLKVKLIGDICTENTAKHFGYFVALFTSNFGQGKIATERSQFGLEVV
jgi:hypothetical protein